MSTDLETLRERLMRRMDDIAGKRFTLDQYNDAVNEAIRLAWPFFFKTVTDTTTVIITDDRLTYTLPSDVERLCEVRLEHATTVVDGTATGSQTSTTLKDTSQSWDDDEYNDDYAVCLTDGTGEGQQRTITDTTSDTITVATWTTTPEDGVTEYIIKEIWEESSAWERLYHWRVENNAGTKVIRLTKQYTSGMSLWLSYIAKYTALSNDTDTTDLDSNWIMLAGENYLYRIWMAGIPEHSSESRRWMLQWTEQQMQEYRVVHADRPPAIQVRYGTSGGISVDSDYPFV